MSLRPLKRLASQAFAILVSSIKRDVSGLLFPALPPSEGQSQGEEAEGQVPGQKGKRPASRSTDTQRGMSSSHISM